MEQNDKTKEIEEIKEEGKNVLKENEEEENENLLLDKEKNEETNNMQFNKDKDNQKSLININNIDIKNGKNEFSQNNNIDNDIINKKDNKYNNVVIGDYIITIKYTKYFHIPFFIFGNILNFYCPCFKFKSQRINLSQMPTPPFAITINESKKYI